MILPMLSNQNTDPVLPILVQKYFYHFLTLGMPFPIKPGDSFLWGELG
jgi:hypothetical protein